MGWRAWDAYERGAEERRRALPWRERYSWRGIIVFALIRPGDVPASDSPCFRASSDSGVIPASNN